MQIPSEMCKCLCMLAFSTKSMQTPFVEDTSLSPNFINVPSHQSCSPNCNFQMTLTKCLTSYLIVWEIFRNVWIMQDLTDKSFGHVCPQSVVMLLQENPMRMQLISQNLGEIVIFQLENPKCSHISIQPLQPGHFVSDQVAERGYLRKLFPVLCNAYCKEGT